MLRKQNLSSSEEKMLAKIHNCPGEKYQRRKIQSAKSRSNMRPIFEVSRRSENDLKKNGVKTLQSIKKNPSYQNKTILLTFQTEFQQN